MKIPYFDAHCDTAMLIANSEGLLFENACHIDLKRLGEYEPRAQFFAIFGAPDHSPGMAYPEIFDKVYRKLKSELKVNEAYVSICLTADDAQKAAGENKTAAFITVEGADLIGCELEDLERAYEMGVRGVTLTWNFRNALSGTNQTGGGLTEQGRRYVKKMYDLGMIVDVSHISDEGFFDICDIAAGPIVATHSNARALWSHSRNLTDDMYRQIVRSGGVAGINLYAAFLGGEGVDVDCVADHICRYLDLGGEKSVCLGGDLDGCDELPAGIRGVEDVHKIFEAMLRRGIGEALARDIFYNNLMGVVKKVCVM